MKLTRQLLNEETDRMMKKKLDTIEEQFEKLYKMLNPASSQLAKMMKERDETKDLVSADLTSLYKLFTKAYDEFEDLQVAIGIAFDRELQNDPGRK